MNNVDFGDITAWVYFYNIFVALSGFVLFCYWWHRVKKASEVYKYFTFLLLALSFEKTIALVIRVETGVRVAFTGSHDSILWHMRTLPTAIILTLIVAMAIRRLASMDEDDKKKN
jgi:hypothetical protein